MRISVSVQGAGDAVAALERGDRRLQAPPSEPLREIGERWAERFRDNVRGGRAEWPPRSPISERLRPGRLMNVTGQLLGTIDHRLRGDREVTAGSEITPKVAALAFGARQGKGAFFPGATIPARPWAVLDDEDVDEAISTLADYYLGSD